MWRISLYQNEELSPVGACHRACGSGRIGKISAHGSRYPRIVLMASLLSIMSISLNRSSLHAFDIAATSTTLNAVNSLSGGTKPYFGGGLLSPACAFAFHSDRVGMGGATRSELERSASASSRTG